MATQKNTPNPMDRNQVEIINLDEEEFKPVQKEELPADLDEQDIIDFYDICFLNDKPFTKTYEIGKGKKKTKVVVRTRMSNEANQISARLDKMISVNPDSTIDPVRQLFDLNMAFSLVSIGDVQYDEGSLDARLQKLNNMPAIKKQIIWEVGQEFDKYVEEIRKSLLNF